MKKVSCLLVCMLLFFSIAGCSSGDISLSSIAESDAPFFSPDTSSVMERPTDEMAVTPVLDDRPTIVFVTQLDSKLQKDAPEAINSYLLEQQVEYKVDFVYIEEENYRDTLLNRIASGEQVDLLFTGDQVIEIVGKTEDYFFQDNVLMDLTEYLSSEEGKELSEAFPDIIWKNLERDGHIYGVSGFIYTSSTPVYYVNKSLMEKYGLSEDDLKRPFSELDEVFELVQKGEGEDFSPLYISDITLPLICSSVFSPQLDFFGQDTETGEVGYVFDFLPVEQNLRAVQRYAQKGYIYSDYPPQTDSYLIAYTSGLGWDSDAAVEIKPEGYSDDYAYGIAPHAIGVYKDSLYTEYALDFLSRMMSDSVLADVIVYGVKGENEKADYTLDQSDKIVVGSENGYIRRLQLLGNPFIVSPTLYEPKEINEIRKKWAEELIWSPYFGRQCRNWSNENVDFESMRPMGMELYRLVDPLNTESYEEIIEDIRVKMNAAGGPSLIDILQDLLN